MINLITKSGDKVWVNPDYIIAIKLDYWGTETYTKVFLPDTQYTVVDKPEEIKVGILKWKKEVREW